MIIVTGIPGPATKSTILSVSRSFVFNLSAMQPTLKRLNKIHILNKPLVT